MLNVLSLGFESNHALERGYQNNPKFLKQMACQLIFVLLYFILRLFIDGSGESYDSNELDNWQILGWELFLALLAGLGIVGFIQYMIQK